MRSPGTKKKASLSLPLALALSLILIIAFSAAPVFAASGAGHSGILPSLGSYFQLAKKGKNKVVVKSVDYDRSDRIVEFEFKGSVKWKSPTVKITRNGKNYAKKIKDKSSNDLKVKVKKLTYGATYSYKITGVKNKKGSKYQTVTGTFSAVDE